MAGFLHLGGANLAMPFIACADDKSQMGLLDSIVNDLGGTLGDLPSGQVPGPLVGQWQVWDDLRLWGQPRRVGSGTLNVQGAGSVTVAKRTFAFNNGAWPGNAASYGNNLSMDTVSGKAKGGANANAGQALNWDASLGSIIGAVNDAVNGRWYEVTAAATDGANPTATVTPVVTQADALATGWRLVRAIVLKCNSLVKPFYILLEEGGTTSIGLRVTVYETWDNTAHTGTNPSATEWMRLYEKVSYYGAGGPYLASSNAANTRNVKTTKCQYVLSLQNDFFALWIGVDTSLGAYNSDGYLGDFVTAFNITPSRNYDTYPTCFAAAWTVASQRTLSLGYNTNGTNGLVQMMKNLLGAGWSNNYVFWPKSMPYMLDSGRDTADLDSAYEFCDVELFQVSQQDASQLKTAKELKRGDVPWLKFPVSAPSTHQNQYSVVNADASVDTYILLQLADLTYTTTMVDPRYDIQGSTSWGQTPYGFNQGGFMVCVRPTQGSVAVSQVFSLRFRWVLVPIS